MNHQDHVNLIRDGMPAPGENEGHAVWADLGSGGGAFTLALADILRASPGAEIYSVDRDKGALGEQQREMQARFPTATVRYLATDFTRPLDLPPLDGVLMANSLHFVRPKEPLLAALRSYLKPGGRLLLVEYNADHGNPWVPYPISFGKWQALAARCGFDETRLLATVPSRFLGEIYSALSL